MNSNEQQQLLNLIADIQGLREEEADLKKDVDEQENKLEIAKEDLADLTGTIKDKVEQLDELIAELTGTEDEVSPYPADWGI